MVRMVAGAVGAWKRDHILDWEVASEVWNYGVRRTVHKELFLLGTMLKTRDNETNTLVVNLAKHHFDCFQSGWRCDRKTAAVSFFQGVEARGRGAHEDAFDVDRLAPCIGKSSFFADGEVSRRGTAGAGRRCLGQSVVRKAGRSAGVLLHSMSYAAGACNLNELPFHLGSVNVSIEQTLSGWGTGLRDASDPCLRDAHI